MNFESHDFRSMTSDEVYHYVKEKAIPGKRMYLFFDELQRIDAWEDAVNSFRVDLDLRHLHYRLQRLPAVPPSIPPISPDDAWRSKCCLSHSGSSWTSTTLKCGNQQRLGAELTGKCLIKTGERYDLREMFDAYMRFGGMPESRDIGLDQEKATEPSGRHLLHRGSAGYSGAGKSGAASVRSPTSALLRKIVLFLADNIGSSVSVSSIGNTLMNEGLWRMVNAKEPPAPTRCRPISPHCWKATSFMKSSGLTIKGKEYLRTLGKYYIVDIGLRNFLLGFRNRDSGHAIENVGLLRTAPPGL